MLVASSNNGAVQNITRELPDRDKAIDGPWKGSDYLAEHVTRLLRRTDEDGNEDGPDAWGLAAATLGNRGNRSRFVDRLWFTREPDGEDKPGWVGLQDWLKEQHEQASPTLWETTVKAFQIALDNEARIRRQRQAVHDVALALPHRETERASAAQRFDRAAGARDRVAEAVVPAEREHAEAIEDADRARKRRQDHHARKPRWYEMMWTLGSSLRRWNAEDEPLARCQRAAEAAEDETAARLRTAKAALSRAEEQVDGAREALAEAGRRLTVSLARIDHVRSSMTGDHAAEHVPDSAWRETERRRETYAPWLDASWNEARTEVFLAALDVHRAFLIGAGWQMRLLLGAAMDAVNGSVPDDAPAEELHAAWQGLFLLVPVVSTTFASVGRMLERVGPEAFGWLLIDEAGQATPQAAVGAIWRARRVVAVGDPLQLEPVLTTLHSAQAQLRDHHGVSDIWLPDQLSVQVLADRVTQVGTTVQRDEEDLWVGAPLRVHRRCDEPMFSVVNDAVYHGLMIHGAAGRRDVLGVLEDDEREPEPLVLDRPVPEGFWADVRTDEVDGRWIPAEGEAAVWILRNLVERHGISPKDILVLAPFRAVAKQLEDLARKKIPGGKQITSGTVHVSQGKQAPVVVLVLAGTTSAPAPGPPSGPTCSTSRSPALSTASTSLATGRTGPTSGTSAPSPGGFRCGGSSTTPKSGPEPGEVIGALGQASFVDSAVRPIGNDRMRISSSPTTAIAPASRSLAITGRFATSSRASSSARRPFVRRSSTNDGPGSRPRAARQSPSPQRRAPDPRWPRRRARPRRWLRRVRGRGRAAPRDRRPTRDRRAALTGCCQAGASCGRGQRDVPLAGKVGREPQGSGDVLRSQIGQVGDDLVRAHPVRKHRDDGGNGNTKAPDRRDATHDRWVHGDMRDRHGIRIGRDAASRPLSVLGWGHG